MTQRWPEKAFVGEDLEGLSHACRKLPAFLYQAQLVIDCATQQWPGQNIRCGNRILYS